MRSVGRESEKKVKKWGNRADIQIVYFNAGAIGYTIDQNIQPGTYEFIDYNIKLLKKEASK